MFHDCIGAMFDLKHRPTFQLGNVKVSLTKNTLDLWAANFLRLITEAIACRVTLNRSQRSIEIR